ncbi:hypothetical protein DL89DRAFT_309371 [Linderina pennispora]|uniref:OPT superfamily oligopeptide transporter n=1 Tax=Linderina pennispora TaxID=61395 RepID=A0A1Y1WIP5_9FUNG|nr:uncharacterized protein DL89DRAFT_309371 [Linderina pennispora]ORX73235.1 hypothetical protein DL89DRAFT_309371 [Linderina pennispora]
MIDAAVSKTDDPSTPSLTFRALLLGGIFSAVLAFVNVYYWFRSNPITLGIPVVQLLSLPAGWILSFVLLTRQFNTFGIRWSLNPGPFSTKEHVLISVMANASTGVAYALDIVVVRRFWIGQPTYTSSFKMFGYITVKQGLMLTKDQKLGYYMRVPPRHFSICQVLGTVVAVFVQLGRHLLADGNCQGYLYRRRGVLFYSTMVLWGDISPERQFSGKYQSLYYMFFVGVALPIPFWLLQRRYSKSIWRHVNISAMLTYIEYMPNSHTNNFVMFTLFCFIFNFLLMKYRYAWWSKYNFALTAALDSRVGWKQKSLPTEQDVVQRCYAAAQLSYCSQLGSLHVVYADLQVLVHSDATMAKTKTPHV